MQTTVNVPGVNKNGQRVAQRKSKLTAKNYLKKNFSEQKLNN
jgi:hypothetical protein